MSYLQTQIDKIRTYVNDLTSKMNNPDLKPGADLITEIDRVQLLEKGLTNKCFDVNTEIYSFKLKSIEQKHL